MILESSFKKIKKLLENVNLNMSKRFQRKILPLPSIHLFVYQKKKKRNIALYHLSRSQFDCEEYL